MNNDKSILVTGNLSDGFEFFGPFESFEEADEYSYGLNQGIGNSWVATLNNPDKYWDEQNPNLDFA